MKVREVENVEEILQTSFYLVFVFCLLLLLSGWHFCLDERKQESFQR
jgi:hypothetical protein